MRAPRYPIYIPSKGRADTRLTALALERIGLEYSIVVEPQEREAYERAVGSERVLVLPFSNLGLGSIPARNWIWEHAIASGARRHWIIDDNIRCFRVWSCNARSECRDGSSFCDIEDFVDGFANVPMAGMQYTMFAVSERNYHGKATNVPFLLNTRIYSCILLSNGVPHRWRGRYNEDTDLSLRFLKNGYCTMLFYKYLCDKQRTMTMKGGNSDELYAGDGRFEMARSLQMQHPDVVKIARKWGRWQHHVDYRPFRKNRPLRSISARS